MALLRVFVADASDVVREAIAGVLPPRPGWELCGAAADGRETIEKVSTLKPDVILLAADLSDPDALTVCRQLLNQQPDHKIIFLGYDDNDQAVHHAFDAGALGYVLKARLTRDLLPAFKALEEGRTFFTPHKAEAILRSRLDQSQNEPKHALSGRERQALKRLAREAVTTVGSNPPPPRWLPRAAKKLALAVIVIVSLVLGWPYFQDLLGNRLPTLDPVLTKVGLKPPTPAPGAGNPETKVWIDVRTGLYYCPGEPAYGKTARGRFARQQDAERDQFQPADRKPCD
jgi:DNA-binding NarL/FixJ family response regulator